MPDSEFKKLLTKVSIDTGDFQGNVKRLKSILDELYQSEKKKSDQQKQALQQQLTDLRKRIDLEKTSAEAQTKASQRHIDALNRTKQAYSDIIAATTRLKAQTDLESISAGTVLKKRQDIVAQCEIEMDRLLKLRQPSQDQLSILQRISSERQRQLALIEKEHTLAMRRTSAAKGTALAGTSVPSAVADTEAQNAAFALRVKLNQATALSEREVLAERQKIVALADKEIAALTAVQTLTKEQKAQLAGVLAIRERQTQAIQRQVLADQSDALIEKRRLETAVTKNVVSGEELKVSEIRLQLSKLQAGQEEKAVELHREIVTILDHQIEAIKAKGALDRDDLSIVNRLVASREREMIAIRQSQLGRGEAAGGAEAGFVGRLERHFAGTFGVTELAGGVFSGAVAAQITYHMLDSMAQKAKALADEADRLQPVQDAFERLGKIRGVDTINFLEQLRGATHDLVTDEQLMRTANAAMQSSMNVSRDQITEMTKATVALARSQGHDATEAVDALQRSFSTGYFRTLAYVTGINQADMGTRSLGRGMPEVIRSQEQFAIMLDALHKKLLLVGDPAITLGERFKILKIEEGRFFEAFYRSLTQTAGFRSFLGLIDDVLTKLRHAEEAGHGLANVIGQWLGSVTIYFKALKDVFEAVYSAFLKPWAEMDKLGDKSKETGSIALDLAQDFGILAEAVSVAAADLAFLVREFVSFIDVRKGVKETIHDMAGEYKDWAQQLKDISHNFTELQKDINEQRHAAAPTAAKTGRPNVPASALLPAPDPTYEIQIAKQKMQLKEALDKEDLENTKAKLQAEKDANEEAYNSLKINFAQYIAEKKRLRTEDLQAALLEAKEDRDAKLAEIRFEEEQATVTLREQMNQAKAQQGTGSPEQRAATAQNISNLKAELGVAVQTYELRKKIIEAQYGGTVSRAQTAEAQAQQQLNDQLVKDAEEAARVRAQAELKVQQESLAEQKSKLEDSFNDGLISADKYLQTRKQQIEEERQLTFASLDEEYSHMADTLANEAKLAEAKNEADIKAKKDSLKLSLQEDDVRFKAAEQSYQRMSKLLSTQAQIAARPGGEQVTGATQIDLLEREISLNAAYIRQLEIQSASLDHQSAMYQKIVEAIAQAQNNQEQYNIELAKARDLMTPIGDFLSKLAGSLGSFHRMGIQEVAEGLRAGATTFQAVGQLRTTIEAQTGANILKSVQQSGKAAFDALRTQSDAASGTLGIFTNALREAVGAVAGFLGALSGERGGIRGAVSVSKLPHYQHGTFAVPQSGPAFLHAGEAVLPTAVLDSLAQTVKQLTASFQSLSGTITALAQKVTGAVFGTPAGAAAPRLQSDLLGVPLGDFNVASLGMQTTSPGDIAKPAEGAFSGLTKFAKALAGEGKEQGVGSVKNFVGTLTGAIGAIGGFLQSTLGAQSTTAGLVGGSLSGLSLGAEVGGPIGAAVGAAFGGIIGAISGHKNAQVMRQIQALTNEFNQVVQKLNDGVVGLNQAIQQAQAIAQQISRQGTGKKGSGASAKQQALQQAEQTLQQLQEKQQQVLKNMQDQLDNLRVPTGYQEWLGSLEQILTQYKQFAEAAQNTQELAQAQEYLTRALQQYAITEGQQVQSAEIEAIQNGLTLNNLYLQRQQLMEQFGQQEQQILSGGVLVREASSSATKAAELQKAQIQFNQQMDQLNLQIATSQYKYETEQKIYGLATDRVGLETQLLQLQFSQIDQQNASNAALLNIVNVIRNTPASQLATTPQLLAALGLPYSGPTAAQVGPQIGQLGTAGTPADFLKVLQTMTRGTWVMQQALGTSNLTTITPAQEQKVLDFLSTLAQTHTESWINSLYQSLQSSMTGAPGSQFNVNYPVPPLYPLTSTPVPWNYSGGIAPGLPGSTVSTNPITGLPAPPGSQFPVPPSVPTGGAPVPWLYAGAPQIQTAQSAGSNPIYYLADPNTGNLVPVFNTPTSFTVQGMGTVGNYITPSFTTPMNVIPSVSSTTGLGSQSGASTSLTDLLAHPGLGEQASVTLPGGPGGFPIIPAGSLPTGMGPTSGSRGPVILAGSSRPDLAGLFGSTFAPPIIASAGLPTAPVSTPINPRFPAPPDPRHDLLTQAATALNTAKVSTEQQITDLTTSRIGMETKLLQMKAQQNQNDLAVLKTLQGVMDGISSGNFAGLGSAIKALNGSGSKYAGVPHIEDMLYNLYSERGRYGEGGFSGNYP